MINEKMFYQGLDWAAITTIVMGIILVFLDRIDIPEKFHNKKKKVLTKR